jgi:hypothetical protein
MLGLALAACNQTPPSWPHLIAQRLSEQYPRFQVTELPAQRLQVERPGLAPMVIDIDPIAAHCLRGPRDCDYAIDQMLLSLRPTAP